MVDMCHYMFVQTHIVCPTPGMNPNVNCGLWMMMMMCHYMFISCNKCTPVMGMLIVCVRARDVKEISVPSV